MWQPNVGGISGKLWEAEKPSSNSTVPGRHGRQNSAIVQFLLFFMFTNTSFSSVGLIRPVLTSWMYATGKIPHCDTSKVDCYSSSTPHIFSRKIWSLVVDVFEIQVCISHLDITAPWPPVVGDYIYGKLACYSTPQPVCAQSKQGVILFNLKCVIQNSVLQCDGTATSLSECSFIKFRGRRVLKCRAMCTVSAE